MPRVQQKRGTAANLTSVNPTPLAGELLVVTDENTLVIGNGTDSYTSLAYVTATPRSHTHLFSEISDITFADPLADNSIVVYSAGVGWITASTIGLIGVGSQPIGGWPSGSVGAALAGKASTTHKSTHATGGSDALSPADIGAAPAASPTFTGTVTVPGLTSTGQILADDNVAANSVVFGFSGDTNCGIGRGGADVLTFVTGGTERVRVDSSGRVGIGTTSPAGQLELERASNADYGGSFSFEGAALIISDNSNSTSYANASAQLQFKVGSSGIAEAWIAGVRNSANVSSMVFGTQSGATRTERVRIKSTGSVRFVPLSADPGSGNEAGDVYYNSSTNKLRVYDGTSWVDLH